MDIPVQKVSTGVQTPCPTFIENMGLDHCRTDILVSEQLLNHPNSVTIFQKMRNEMEKEMPLKFLHLPYTKEKAANRINSGLAALLIQV